MSILAAAVIALMAFALSSWGWGSLLLRFTGPVRNAAPACSVSLGIAVLALLGGWLTLFGIAVAPALWLLLIAGWIAASRSISLPKLPNWIQSADRGVLVIAAAIGLLGLYLAWSLLPGAAFNPADDLRVYMIRPIRILQTGGLGRDPFDSVGMESLGLHSFLQAFTLLVSPAEFLNAFDAVFCAVLALFLVLEIGRAAGASTLATGCAVLCLALLPAQQVNTSAVYAITVFALAIVPATRTVLSTEKNAASLWLRALPLAAVLATLVGLKATSASFVIGTLVVLAILLVYGRGVGPAVRALACTAVLMGGMLLPWLVMHWDKYSRMLEPSSRRNILQAGVVPLSDLFTSRALYWGGDVLAYTALALFVGIVGIAAGVRLRRQSEYSQDGVIPLVAVCVAASISYFLSSAIYDLSHVVRYSLPMLAAGFACSVLLCEALLVSAPRGAGRPHAVVPRIATAALVCIPVAIGFIFSAPIATRASTLTQYHSVLSMPPSAVDVYRRYTEYAMGPAQNAVRLAQLKTPPGERVLAMIEQPQHLLYARNRVFVGFDFGLAWPWLNVPDAAGASELAAFLRGYGIRYVMWQEEPLAAAPESLLKKFLDDEWPILRESARRTLWVRKSMQLLTDTPAVIYRGGGIVVLDIAKAS